jgi:outer membrane protein assembly factor BamD
MAGAGDSWGCDRAAATAARRQDRAEQGQAMARRTSERAMTFRTAVCLFVLAAMAGAGCSSGSDLLAKKALNPDPPDKMYAHADSLLAKGAYSDAAKRFEDLDRDHPYSREARRAMVMAAYAYYKAGKFPEAIAAGKRYTMMHPGTKDACLAHYVVASANFDDIKDPHRDQTATRKALAELKQLVQRCPDSPYGKQAVNRMRIAEDILAASEMNIGRWHLDRQLYTGAINRFKTVVTDYQTTPQVEEALYRLVEANLRLGVLPEAQAAGAVLGHNFPNSPWYKRAHAHLKASGVSPQMGSNTWLTRTLKAKEPTVRPRQPGPGEPPADAMPPAPRRGNVPTATTPTAKPPLGFAEAR